MIDTFSNLNRSIRLTAAIVLLCGLVQSVWADEPKADEPAATNPSAENPPIGQYYVDAKLFSYLPDHALDTYHDHGGGGVGPTGSLGLNAIENNRRFSVDVVGRLKSQQFLVTVKVKPKPHDSQTLPLEKELDLSDLKPQSLEIAHDPDGRVYKLNLTPRIMEFPKAKQFQVSDLRLESWSFPASPVIVNNEDYIGELSMSYGPVCWCDIPGLAKIEFSLLHLKNSQALGTLQDGVINITNPQAGAASDGATKNVSEVSTTLRISNVKNGVNHEILSGGPYQVWVRWKEPSMSIEQARAAMQTELAEIKERIKSGDLSLPASVLENLEKKSKSDRIQLLSFGVRQANKDELAEPSK
jgi:hypothetical protein